MSVVVIGPGAVGGTIAVRLSESGHDVEVVARGPHLRRSSVTGSGPSAQLHGLTAPVNELLQRLVRQLAVAGATPGSVPATDVLAALTPATHRVRERRRWISAVRARR